MNPRQPTADSHCDTSHDTMRAWSLGAFGREHLRLGQVPLLLPKPGEVLVRVRAMSLNYRDKLVIEGQLLPELPGMPFTPVSDMAGEVEALGEGVDRIRVGDRVVANFRTTWIDGPPTTESSNPDTTLGGPLPGVMADYAVIPAAALAVLPPDISFQEAATLPIAGLTAWMALDPSAESSSRETVLLQGTGGVSLFALQFALAMKHEVILTSRSDAKLDRARALGAFTAINSRTYPDWAEQALRITNGRGVDRIVETIGGANLKRSLDALAIGGTISQVGFLGGVGLSFAAVPLMLKHATLRGISVGDRRSLEQMLTFVSKQRIRPVVDRIYPFEQLPDALAHLDRGPFGKVVLSGSED